MISDFPVPFLHTRPGALLSRHHDAGRVPLAAHRWDYVLSGHPRARLGFAMLASVLVHAAAFLFIGPTKEARPKVITHEAPTIALVVPNLEDLEEPPTNTTSDGETPVETPTYVPMQADLPQVAASTDFVQRLDFNSLIERPDMSAAKVFAIPDTNRGAAIRQNIGMVFNLADLDRVPEPLVRVSPIFPNQYKRDVLSATVKVQFIVDTNGGVVNAVVVDSTHSGFNEAALIGVSKWKFRPGIKAGRRVNTRMEIPIVFKIVED